MSKYYEDYLQSPHWQELKERFWNSKLKKICGICGCSGRLELHHKYGYGKVGKEKLLHLVPLCRTCHHNVHFLEDGTRLPNTYDNLYRRFKSLKRRKGKLGRKPYIFIIK